MEVVPRLFVIISWGNAGTYWLTKVLNAHPEIFCLHHAKWYWARVTGGKEIEDIDYLNIIQLQGRAYRLAGDVHGVARASIPSLNKEFGNRFRCASLVRHPVPRVRSHLMHAAAAGLHSYGIDRRRLKNSVDPSLRRLLSDDERVFFVHLMGLVNVVVEEQAFGPVYTLERLTADPAELSALVKHISGGELTFGENLLAWNWRHPVNRHACNSGALAADGVFRSLPEWQQELFRALLSPRARQIYEGLGYDLSFV